MHHDHHLAVENYRGERVTGGRRRGPLQQRGMLGSYGKLLDGGQIIVRERGGRTRERVGEGRPYTTIFEECTLG